jgi:hypothetical protein
MLLIVWHHDHTLSMPSNRNHALRDGIKVSFMGKSHDTLDES